MSIYADAKYQDVPVEKKQALFDEVKADMRFEHMLYGCYECGICVAACPLSYASTSCALEYVT